MAQAFPASTFLGTDYHEGVDPGGPAARRGGRCGGPRPVRGHGRRPSSPAGGFDLITMFDCLHDMGDPAAAARAARRALADDGTLMVVEPAAGDTRRDNLTPRPGVLRRLDPGLHTVSLAQPGAAALGAQAGPARIGAVLSDAGFSRVRVAARSPVNLVFEARP